MRAPERWQDDAALERLREHEAALSQRLAGARAEADRTRADADAAAAAIRREAARELQSEVEDAERAASRALEAELAAGREAAQREVERTRHVAPAVREEALRWVVRLASGGPP